MTWFRNLTVVFLGLPPLILLLMVVFLGIPTRDESGTFRKLIAAVREMIVVLTQSDSSRPVWPLLQFTLSAAAVYILILRALLVLPFVFLLLLHDEVTKGLSK